MIWTGQFWKATAERAISTAAQVAIVTIGAEQFHVLAADWTTIAGMAAGGAFLAVLKAVAAGAATGDGPSLTHAEQVAYDGRHRP